MPITRTNITLGDATTEPSVAWENEIKNSINNLKDNAVDTTDGNINATSITAGASSGSGSAGNRSLIFKVTDTIQKILRWDNTAGWMKLLNQAGALLPLAVADPTDATHAMTLGYFNVTRLFPKGYISGPAPVYTSASTVTFKAGLKARNSANTADIELTADVPVSLAISGAGGLDSGAEAANTWHYYYLIRKSGDGTTSVVASTINEAAAGSITLPTGYDQKRQLPLAVRNDASSNIIPFYVAEGWPYQPLIVYDVDYAHGDTGHTASATEVLNLGTATSFTDVSCANYKPGISGIVLCRVFVSGASASTATIRGKGQTAANGFATIYSGGGNRMIEHLRLLTDASGNIQYRQASGVGVTIQVVGFIVTGGV